MNRPVGGEEKVKAPFRYPRETRIDHLLFCYNHCVNDYREKILGAYEKDCLYKCAENRLGAFIDIRNSIKVYQKKEENLKELQ